MCIPCVMCGACWEPGNNSIANEGICPECGAFVPPDAFTCPECYTLIPRYQATTTRVYTPASMPSKVGTNVPQ